MGTDKHYTDLNSLYQQAVDKQRVVITGNQAGVITSMIVHVLSQFHRKFDLVRNGEYDGDQPINETEAPVVIIEESRKPFSTLLGYHHHMTIISDIDDTPEVVQNMKAFADASPKAGTIIYSDRGKTSVIAKEARPDVTATPYSTYSSKQENGKIFLVTSTSERVPIQLSGEDNLRNISAAKELLKKTGISSGQFYQAMTSFKL